MNRYLVNGAVGSALLLAASGASADEIIDLFDEPAGSDQTVIADSDNLTDFDEDGPFGTVLGGYRDLFVQYFGEDSATDRSVMTVENGTLSFSNDDGVTGYAEVTWDGQDNSSDVALDNFVFDLTGGGTADSFLIETLTSDLGWSFEIQAWTDATSFSTINVDADEVDPEGAPTFFNIPFAAFGNCGFLGGEGDPLNSVTCGDNPVDFTSLVALQARINVNEEGTPGQGTGSLDLSIGSATAVPEPATIGLLGIGLLATAAGFRRRHTQSE
ncbi:MAG: PEP-CTERM sorting domain-containing protein [Spiribacter salinus]|uniref:PEP-CTERM sorting domain-containing protein n=1 Tax=Spiribacter salinus TaxID=1335746 RepID=A0A540VPS7_9GAMM|nr:MAG: PEP-CTERM sorting domain-containing protein [Spiribacter salinus]